jgi:hypothetical protein
VIRWSLLVGALLTLFAVPACGSTPPPTPVEPTYAERVLERIKTAQSEPAFAVRHNPTPCGCPPYEVALGDVWHRAAFVGSDPEDEAIMALEAAVKEASGRDRAEVWLVQADLEERLTTCGRGTLVVGVGLRAFGAGEEPEPAETDSDSDSDE